MTRPPGLPQPIGAAIAYLLVETVKDLLPYSFGFAAGAMLALVVSDLAPRAFVSRGAGRGAAALWRVRR